MNCLGMLRLIRSVGGGGYQSAFIHLGHGSFRAFRRVKAKVPTVFSTWKYADALPRASLSQIGVSQNFGAFCLDVRTLTVCQRMGFPY